VGWSADDVLQAPAAWVSPWFPPNSTHVDIGWLEFYQENGAATVMRVAPRAMTGEELVSSVLAELGSRSEPGHLGTD
jgi:hypothetical protein